MILKKEKLKIKIKFMKLLCNKYNIKHRKGNDNHKKFYH